jgi:hypothetical protein
MCVRGGTGSASNQQQQSKVPANLAGTPPVGHQCLAGGIPMRVKTHQELRAIDVALTPAVAKIQLALSEGRGRSPKITWLVKYSQKLKSIL